MVYCNYPILYPLDNYLSVNFVCRLTILYPAAYFLVSARQQQQQLQQANQVLPPNTQSNHLATAPTNGHAGQRPPPQSPQCPPPPTANVVDKPFLSNRDHLPPPSGTEAVTSPREPIQTLPPRAPVQVPETAPRPDPSAGQQLPIRRDRALSAPKPKAKPKPGPNRGQVRTASEYHAAESPNKGVIIPTPAVQQKNTPPQNDESETVTASRSRGKSSQCVSETIEASLDGYCLDLSTLSWLQLGMARFRVAVFLATISNR